MKKLIATLTPVTNLVGVISVDNNRNIVSGEITIPLGEQVANYNGAYRVTPLAHSSTILYTEGKKLLDNVLVEKVPYYETSNIYDGYTVYIAEDINNA